MRTVNVQITVPEGIAPYLDDTDRDIYFERNAMLLHPYIQRGVISHGRAAEILGVRKWDLIEYYNGLGIPYLNQEKKDLLADLAAFDRVMGWKNDCCIGFNPIDNMMKAARVDLLHDLFGEIVIPEAVYQE